MHITQIDTYTIIYLMVPKCGWPIGNEMLNVV